MSGALLGSASQLSRTLVCPAGTMLPDLLKRQKSWDVAAARGTALHHYVELAPEDTWRALATMPRSVEQEDGTSVIVPASVREEAKTIPLHRLAGRRTPPELREVAMIHNLTSETVRVVEGGHREYGELADDDVPGTFDVCIVGYRSAEVWDYKFGRRKVKAEENDQLLDGALKVVRQFAPNATHVVAGIQQFVTKGKGKKKRLVPEDSYIVVDRFDINAHEQKKQLAFRLAQEIKQAIEADEVPAVVRGNHCTFCPAKPACPAHVGEKLYRIQMRKHRAL